MVGPVFDEILIEKLRSGHELDIKLHAMIGVGRNHAKFSPLQHFVYTCPKSLFSGLLLIESFERIQKLWERNNSLCGKFKEQSNMDAMWQYCQMTLKSSKKIVLFGILVRDKFSQLYKAVEDEAVARVTRQIITKGERWLFDFKWTQNHMDLYLIGLLDDGRVVDIVRFLRRPRMLFDVVLKKLVGEIALNSWPSDKVWRLLVVEVVKSSVKSSVEKALSGKERRSPQFMAELRANLVDNLESDLLSQTLRMDLVDDFKELDNEPDEEFARVCGEDVITFIDSQLELDENAEFSQRIAELVVEKLRAMNAPGVIPRCQHSCPWCGGLCIREPGHGVSTIKHDTIHQPGGLHGVHVRGLNTLSATICSNRDDENYMYDYFNGIEECFQFRDWSFKYPEWQKPHIAQEWPLREYIFYHYHREIADYWKLLPCTKIPESYNRDLNAISDSLKRGPVELMKRQEKK